MSLLRYEPWNTLSRLHRQIDDVFGTLAAGQTRSEEAVEWIPAVDIQEQDDRFIVRADVPGVQTKDLSVTADKNVLTVRGRREFDHTEQQNVYARRERLAGRFARRFTLPDNVDPAQITARHAHGVLELTIPKTRAAEPRRVAVETH